jgi:hypothetical protein
MIDSNEVSQFAERHISNQAEINRKFELFTRFFIVRGFPRDYKIFLPRGKRLLIPGSGGKGELIASEDFDKFY